MENNDKEFQTYYEADICYASERFINNDKNQGCDPDTFCDNGYVETISNETLEGLKNDLISRFEYIEHVEDNRYDTGYEETERDGTHYSIMISIYINKVEMRRSDVNFENEV